MKRKKDGLAAKRQAIRAQIDDNLGRAYRAILDEELPERFRELLAQLKQVDPPKKDTDG